ncbi:basic salivary proline-rich protein 3-like [Trachinotus anak]|uniref:basic salivary proline-rich protein 3-like n=1 Tax=Trachinotus anak TaxID=443729 RepID=UPI0039F1BEC9
MDQDREEGAPPSKTTLCGGHESQTRAQSIRKQQERPDSPEPSCVSMNSDRSIGHYIDFKDGRPADGSPEQQLRPDLPGPEPDCLSMKSTGGQKPGHRDSQPPPEPKDPRQHAPPAATCPTQGGARKGVQRQQPPAQGGPQRDSGRKPQSQPATTNPSASRTQSQLAPATEGLPTPPAENLPHTGEVPTPQPPPAAARYSGPSDPAGQMGEGGQTESPPPRREAKPGGIENSRPPRSAPNPIPQNSPAGPRVSQKCPDYPPEPQTPAAGPPATSPPWIFFPHIAGSPHSPHGTRNR